MNTFRMPDEGQLTIADIAAVVEQAVFPFKPGMIKAWTSDAMITLDHYTISVEVEILRDHDFFTHLDRARLTTESPYDVMKSFYKALFDHYRYRPSLPVDDHIQLGED